MVSVRFLFRSRAWLVLLLVIQKHTLFLLSRLELEEELSYWFLVGNIGVSSLYNPYINFLVPY